MSNNFISASYNNQSFGQKMIDLVINTLMFISPPHRFQEILIDVTTCRQFLNINNCQLKNGTIRHEINERDKQVGHQPSHLVSIKTYSRTLEVTSVQCQRVNGKGLIFTCPFYKSTTRKNNILLLLYNVYTTFF